MLRPNSQPLTGFETGWPASNPSTRFEAAARVVSASFDRTILPRPFFTRVLDRSVSYIASLGPRPFLYVPMRMRRERGGAGKKGSGDTA